MLERLPDWCYNEEEIAEYNAELLATRYIPMTHEKGHIVAYKLYGSKGYTGKVMLMHTEDIDGLQTAADNEWKDTRIRCIVGCSREAYIDEYWAVMKVLDRWKYKPKYDRIGSDRVFSWEDWMDKLIGE